MSRDEKKSDNVERERLQDIELKRFREHVLGAKPRQRTTLRR
jgi:hypothetical protein